MPQRRKSRKTEVEEMLNAAKELERECKRHTEEIYDRTVKQSLREKGYELVSYLDGELDADFSDDLRRMIVDGISPAELGPMVRPHMMDDGIGVPDFVLKNSDDEYGAVIETMGAIIEVFDRNLLPEIEQFAEVWENERSDFIRHLISDYSEQLEVSGFHHNEEEIHDGFSLQVTTIER